MPERHTIFDGYVRAVNGAAAAYIALFLLKVSTESSPGSSLVSALPWDIVPLCIVGVTFWVAAFFTAWPLYAATYFVARHFRIRSAFYYVACGALTGLVLTPIFVAIGPQMSWQNENDFREDSLTWGPILVMSGLCGALAFWHKIGRYLGRA